AQGLETIERKGSRGVGGVGEKSHSSFFILHSSFFILLIAQGGVSHTREWAQDLRPYFLTSTNIRFLLGMRL
ncbi:hypothetical protein QHH11_27485, partial [Aphanizomenon sp. PH219]|nr:hypothetical protein [Aphanizomenon sp. PH219]